MNSKTPYGAFIFLGSNHKNETWRTQGERQLQEANFVSSPWFTRIEITVEFGITVKLEILTVPKITRQ